MLGHQQVTDGYLLAVADHCGLQLVTFDRRLEALTTDADLVLCLDPWLGRALGTAR